MKFTYASGDRPLDGYTIKQGLGRGGFGEVYRALSDGGKEVALKLIQRNLDIELRGVNHCLNLKHPNLMLLYDVKETDAGDHWVVMEYVAGTSLDQAIAAHSQGMPADEVLGWLRGIGDGVDHLHERGIVHRDLKPSNLFMEGGLVKIGDYGLSKFMSASRRSGQTGSIGTVHYLAPEVMKGRYGKEIDLYSLGVILYEMLTGHVPFDGESPGEVLMKHLASAPDVSVLAEPFRSVVARLLEKDPEQRYPSVKDLLADLDRQLAGAAPPEPLPAAEPVSRVTDAWKESPFPTDSRIPPIPQLRASGPLRRVVAGPRFWRPVEVGLRLAVALFLGAGLGLLAAGIVIFTARDRYAADHAASFLGPGAGLLFSSLILSALCGVLPGPHRWWPLLPVLLFGIGSGLSAAGLTIALSRDYYRAEHAASFLGPGSGFLGCVFAAVVLYSLLGTVPRLRMLWALFLGAGVGLSVAGVTFLLARDVYSAESVASFVGPGAGLFTCGATVFLFYCSRLMWRPPQPHRLFQ